LQNSPHSPLGGTGTGSDPRDVRASEHITRVDEIPAQGPFLIGLPYDGGIPTRPGARFGPRALREALSGYGAFSGTADIPHVADLGDLTLPTMDGGVTHARIEQASERAFSAGGIPIFIGGDHGCTGSVIRGLAASRPRLRLALISIDAHLDVREYEDASRLSSGTPFRRALECSILDGSNTAMIGVRRFANSRYYLDWAAQQGVHLHGVDAVAERGARTLARDVLETVMNNADALYLSVDMDAADAAVAPGVSAPGAGGLSSREMIDLVSEIASHPLLIGADIMELSPPNDPDSRTVRLAARLLLEILTACSR
jgi:formimidoylglutamase